MRALFKILRLIGDARAARRGPAALARRHAKRMAHNRLRRVLDRAK